MAIIESLCRHLRRMLATIHKHLTKSKTYQKASKIYQQPFFLQSMLTLRLVLGRSMLVRL